MYFFFNFDNCKYEIAKSSFKTKHASVDNNLKAKNDVSILSSMKQILMLDLKLSLKKLLKNNEFAIISFYMC